MAPGNDSSSISGFDSEEALNLLGKKELRISELKKENASLRSQLEALRSPQSADAETARKRKRSDVEDYQTSTERQIGLIKKYNDLSKLYRDLEKKHAKCKPHIENALKKYKVAKERARQWKSYADHLVVTSFADHVRSSVKEDTPSGPNKDDDAGSDLNVLSRRSCLDEPRTSDMGTARLFGDATNFIALEPSLQPSRETIDEQVSSRQRACSPENPMSDQTAETEADATHPQGLLSNEVPPSSDSEPVVVSARPVRRNRGHSREIAGRHVRVKREPTSPDSTTPIIPDHTRKKAASCYSVIELESSDLDTPTDKMQTPRKSALLRQQHPRALSEDISRPSTLITRVSSHSDNDVCGGSLKTKAARILAGVRTTKHNTGPGIATPVHGVRRNTSSRDLDGNALRPRSVNVPPGRGLQDGRPATAHKQEDLSSKVRMLSEDGDDGCLAQAAAVQKDPEQDNVPKTHPSRRLDGLLESPLTENRILSSILTPVSAQATTKNASAHRSIAAKQFPSSGANTKIPITPTTGNPRSNATRPHKHDQSGQPRKPLNVDDSPPPVQPEDEPLRLRSAKALRLEDFKINPKYMGSDFAFADSLRGRDQRRCMPGCTKPECCGRAFVKAVEMGGGLRSSQTDAEVLEAYLGPDWDRLVAAHGPERRREVLVQARAAAFADRYGKHRHAFARRSTPPGFWRTDMPSTQEEAADRAQGRELEQTKVEERWREAMREGGRWLFRDE